VHRVGRGSADLATEAGVCWPWGRGDRDPLYFSSCGARLGDADDRRGRRRRVLLAALRAGDLDWTGRGFFFRFRGVPDKMEPN
jgi:hypothetical protein